MKYDFEDELDAIRVKLYEETKGLDSAEFAKELNSRAKRIADKYGIKIRSTDSYVTKEFVG
jgi:hypothetical protein